MKNKSYDITVFIPTWFGINYIEELLNSVLKQKINQSFEVLIYDTSSTDGTLEVIKKFAKINKNIRWKSISKDEFGHGKTRQEAAQDAYGEVVVYLSQDALPAHDMWLYEMIQPFKLNKNIVAVMGKQDPRPNAFPLLKYEIQDVFSSFGPDLGTTLFFSDYFIKNKGQYDFISFYSDVNSAARKNTLLDIPYRDVNYAEDQLLGRDVIDAGLMKAYAARGTVVHSNEIRLNEYAARMFDETLGMRQVGINVEKPTIVTCLKMITRGVVRDTLRIVIDRDYSVSRKIYWLFVNPLFHLEKWRGVRRGADTKIDGHSETLNKYSLEHRRQKKFESRQA
jgi:rhamnosyltransferase